MLSAPFTDRIIHILSQLSAFQSDAKPSLFIVRPLPCPPVPAPDSFSVMAESLIYDLGKAVGNKLLEEGSLLIDVQEEARKMVENLRIIETVLNSAEKKEVRETHVKIWLSDLKNVAYDIEDVLDDWRIAELQMGDEFGKSQQGPKSKAKVPFPFISSPCFCFRQVKSRHDIAQRIKAINERLGEIGDAKNKFSFPTSNIRITEGPKLRATSAYGNYAVVRRQEEVKAKVIQMLVHGESKRNVANGNHIPTLSLVGMGGIGKTTLARLVYNDDSVKGHFSITIWVCVSKPFNEMNVAKAIAEGLNLDVRNDSTKQNVLSKIDGSIRGQKFLLVLDDVWEDSQGKWRDILGCLGKGDKEGSWILMTTRNSEFSKKIGADIVSVGELCAEDAWSLFSYYAFIGDSDHREEVKDIAEKLAEKCHGLPLALEVLGRHMAAKTTRSEWDDVLTSELWKAEFQDRVFNSLAISYVELPSAAKRCFAFCSIFPKDTIMRKNNLIRLWMAQGYLQGGKGDQMEDLGEWCFESLETRSFFRVSKIRFDEFADNEVTMHDLVHDFAHYISNGEVAILDPSLEIHEGGVISTKLRHLTISGEICKSNRPYLESQLRSLFLSTDSTLVIKELCSKKSYIRALGINISPRLEALDDYDFKDIGKLIHLRYLRLTVSRMLSEDICGLPYLQTLDLRECYGLEKLPREIGRLTGLRHLLFERIVLKSLPKGLGKLSSLRTLSCFLCSGAADEDCSSLEDLRGLNNLRGVLWLKNLDSVANGDEAIKAELHMKKQIRRLTLEFGDGHASLQAIRAKLQSEVLEALRPAEGSIEFLKISIYRGEVYPRWVGKMRYLKEVQLWHVSTESLPALGILRFLEKFSVEGANMVRRVGEEILGRADQDRPFFPKLRDLNFEDMPLWEHWEGPREIMRRRVTIMPSLCHLRIKSCKALRTLPRFLGHVPLESLEVDSDRLPLVELTWDEHPKRLQIGDILLPSTLKDIRTPFIESREMEAPIQLKAGEVVQQQSLNLNFLKVDATYGLTGATIPRWITGVTNLRVIELTNLEDDSLPPLGSLTYLEELTIKDARRVEKVGGEFLGISNNNNDDDDGDPSRGRGKSVSAFIAFPRLEKLSFMGMLAWREWEDPAADGGYNLAIMPSLWRLEITRCEKLKSLPHFFEAVPLKNLEVGATKEGDMLKIRDTSTSEDDEPAWMKAISSASFSCERIKARSNTALAMDFIRLYGVKNEWLLDWAKHCGRLRKLQLHNCGEASFVRLEVSLPSLETLMVYKCDFRRMGTGILRLSCLKEINFVGMDVWEEWEDSSPHQLGIISPDEWKESNAATTGAINFKPSLRLLYFWGCPKLKALPSLLRSVPLAELIVEDCDALKTWWINEAGEDWHTWISSIPTVVFPGTFWSDHRHTIFFPSKFGPKCSESSNNVLVVFAVPKHFRDSIMVSTNSWPT